MSVHVLLAALAVSAALAVDNAHQRQWPWVALNITAVALCWVAIALRAIS